MQANDDTTNGSDGTIKIIDTDGVHERSASPLEGELTIDVASGDPPRIAASLETVDSLEFVDQPIEGGRSESGSDGRVGDGVHGRPEIGGAPAFWLALLPTLTVGLGAIGVLLFGQSLWSPEASTLGTPLVHVGRVIAFGTGLAGTLWMWTDAAELRAGGAAWQPSTWLYSGAGGLVFATAGAAFFLFRGHPLEVVGAGFLGLCLVGIPMSSVVAGPVYLYNRYRNVGVRPSGEV